MFAGAFSKRNTKYGLDSIAWSADAYAFLEPAGRGAARVELHQAVAIVLRERAAIGLRRQTREDLLGARASELPAPWDGRRR